MEGLEVGKAKIWSFGLKNRDNFGAQFRVFPSFGRGFSFPPSALLPTLGFYFDGVHFAETPSNCTKITKQLHFVVFV